MARLRLSTHVRMKPAPQPPVPARAAPAWRRNMNSGILPKGSSAGLVKVRRRFHKGKGNVDDAIGHAVILASGKLDGAAARGRPHHISAAMPSRAMVPRERLRPAPAPAHRGGARRVMAPVCQCSSFGGREHERIFRVGAFVRRVMRAGTSLPAGPGWESRRRTPRRVRACPARRRIGGRAFRSSVHEMLSSAGIRDAISV